MPKLTINDKTVDVPDGATLLEAARSMGISVPALCKRDGCKPQTSCMVCVMQVEGAKSLVPSCAMPARDGMKVHTDTPEVAESRKATLELLLSDHAGDCVGPCELADARHIDIPRMIRAIAAGEVRTAADIVARAADPRTLTADAGLRGEKACRRGQHDAPVAIGLLMQYVAGKARELNIGPAGEPATFRKYSAHLGKVSPAEMEQFLAAASRSPRVAPANGQTGYSDAEAKADAARCLHCDFRKKDACLLRDAAEAAAAHTHHYQADRPAFQQWTDHPTLVFEPGKCIACGLCVQIARRHGEKVGLAMTGRGFGVRVSVPFGKSLAEALTTSAADIAAACPTAAFAIKNL